MSQSSQRTRTNNAHTGNNDNDTLSLKTRNSSNENESIARSAIDQNVNDYNDDYNDDDDDDVDTKMTLVAQSITSLAKALKEIQSQMKEFDKRLMNLDETQQRQQQNRKLPSFIPLESPGNTVKTSVTELSTPTHCSPKFHTSPYTERISMDSTTIQKRKKKEQDFTKAYKTVLSIAKAFKILPETKKLLKLSDTRTCTSSPATTVAVDKRNLNEHINDHSSVGVTGSDKSSSEALLRNIALSLSDIDTSTIVSVASYLSHDDDINSVITTNSTNNDNITTSTSVNRNKHSIDENGNEEEMHAAVAGADYNNDKKNKENQMVIDMVQLEQILNEHSRKSFRIHIVITWICCCCCCCLSLSPFSPSSFGLDDHDNNYQGNYGEKEKVIGTMTTASKIVTATNTITRGKDSGLSTIINNIQHNKDEQEEERQQHVQQNHSGDGNNINFMSNEIERSILHTYDLKNDICYEDEYGLHGNRLCNYYNYKEMVNEEEKDEILLLTKWSEEKRIDHVETEDEGNGAVLGEEEEKATEMGYLEMKEDIRFQILTIKVQTLSSFGEALLMLLIP